MAISFTSTGSQYLIATGTSEEVVNFLMISGIGTAGLTGYASPSVGSVSVMVQRTP